MRIRKPPHDELNTLLRISNQTLALFNQPPLYAPVASVTHAAAAALKEDLSDRFHISLAWSLTAPSEQDQDRVSAVGLLRPLESLNIGFSSVKVKIGNTVKSLELGR